jgi:methylglutamate dehydrogenase subunit D
VASPSTAGIAAGRSGRATNAPGLIARQSATVNLASIASRRGQTEALSEAVSRAFGVSLPITPRVAAADGISFIWGGANRWLVEAACVPDAGVESFLGAHLGQFAAICDQSDSRIMVDLQGPKVREVLAKGLPIDLDPRRFQVGDVAMTTVSHIGVHVWQTSPQPIYRMSVARSYYESFARWLTASAAEFGCELI